MKLISVLFIFTLPNIIEHINITKYDNILNNDFRLNYLIHNNNEYVNILGFTLLLIPIILRNGEICTSDFDCPYKLMKCCQIGNIKYCCTPDNFIKLEFAYTKN